MNRFRIFFGIIMASLLLVACGSSDESAFESSDATNVITEENDVNSEESGNTDGGGNQYASDGKGESVEIKVLVDEDTYIYDNSPVSLDDLVETIEGMEGDITVRITDHNATRNAYKNLTKRLDGIDVKYIDE